MDILSELSINGHVELFDVQNIEEAIRVTSQLGAVIPLNGHALQKLVPRDREVATSTSFSKKYGRTAFPLHTDTAFWVKPARFAVFFMLDVSQTATQVLSLQDTQELINLAKRSNPIFIRQTVSGPVYSRPWSEEIGGCALYDPCYMRPVNRAATDFENVVKKMSAQTHRVTWTGRKALIIDNWRVLHGREGCDNTMRILFRFYRGRANELGA